MADLYVCNDCGEEVKLLGDMKCPWCGSEDLVEYEEMQELLREDPDG